MINIRDKLLNKYSNNHVLLSGAFPTWFPLGLTAESIGGGGPLSKKLVRKLMLFYDRRFANNAQFVFYCLISFRGIQLTVKSQSNYEMGSSGNIIT